MLVGRRWHAGMQDADISLQLGFDSSLSQFFKVWTIQKFAETYFKVGTENQNPTKENPSLRGQDGGDQKIS